MVNDSLATVGEDVRFILKGASCAMESFQLNCVSSKRTRCFSKVNGLKLSNFFAL